MKRGPGGHSADRFNWVIFMMIDTEHAAWCLLRISENCYSYVNNRHVFCWSRTDDMIWWQRDTMALKVWHHTSQRSGIHHHTWLMGANMTKSVTVTYLESLNSLRGGGGFFSINAFFAVTHYVTDCYHIKAQLFNSNISLRCSHPVS